MPYLKTSGPTFSTSPTKAKTPANPKGGKGNMTQEMDLINEAVEKLESGVPVAELDGRLIFRCLFVLLHATADLAAVAQYMEAVCEEAQRLDPDLEKT